MKVTITHLKAPWPVGAAVGQVVEVGDSLPGCFVGKCSVTGDDAEVAHTYVTAEPLAAAVAATTQPPVDPDQAKIDASMRAAAEQEVHELHRLLADAEAALAVKAGELEAAQISNAELGQKLADAEAALSAAPKAKGAK